jgi:transcriptional regulator GlxA family with amidase domain
LLAVADRKVTDIAMECGFANLANFNRRFHEIMGLPLSQYRRTALSRFKSAANGE